MKIPVIVIAEYMSCRQVKSFLRKPLPGIKVKWVLEIDRGVATPGDRPPTHTWSMVRFLEPGEPIETKEYSLLEHIEDVEESLLQDYPDMSYLEHRQQHEQHKIKPCEKCV